MDYEKWVFKYSTIISIISCLIIYINVCKLNMGLKGVYIGIGMMYWMLALGYRRKFNTYRY